MNVPDRFWVRRKVFTLFAQKFHIYDMQDQLIGFCKQKAFKLKEDIRVYADESMTQEAIAIRARTILDWSVALDVVDSATQQRVGTLKRKGWKSAFWRDEWVVMDATEREIATIQEDSALLAFVRRHLINLVPQHFNFLVDGRVIGRAKQNFNFLVAKMHADFSDDMPPRIDRRLAMAAVLLLMAVEGRQEG